MSTDVDAAQSVLEVGEFYRLVTEHLESAFGRRHARWVRGEIAKVYEKNHLYVDLADAGVATSDAKRAVLNAHCWASQWAQVKRTLAESGVTLQSGMIVSFYGYVDVYAPQGRIGFTVTDVDVTSLLGDVARRRAELIARLGAENLLEANKRVPLSPVPLRVGLVASPQTEGFNDFTGQLLRSGYAFDVRLVTTQVQGEVAPAQIVRAIETLDATDVDVICVVRGGGSKGDLACFDDERVARAIAMARTPVFTGIGHTGDESVADLVAHTRAITPTKLGEEIVTLVDAWRERMVVAPARRLSASAQAVLDEADNYVGERRRTMNFAVRDRLRAEARHLASTRERLDISARRVLEASAASLQSVRQLLGAYDPARRLAQGWSIVTNAHGAVVRTLSQLEVGATMSVRVSDGTFISVVTEKGTP
ncbi:MAG TPA: exodeoxyribonuclease VII large subunit [Acidimicrobiales bacterium]|nr:exodeoxyribonuclease VII large subunit [Acidimicrobiales bacterium]